MSGLKCSSNPELDLYIKKPKFSRDRYDYKVSREGYNPRKLVCPEMITSKKRGKFKTTVDQTLPCTDVPKFSEVVSIVAENMEIFKLSGESDSDLTILDFNWSRISQNGIESGYSDYYRSSREIIRPDRN